MNKSPMSAPPSIRSVDLNPDQFRDLASNAVLAADRLSADHGSSRVRQVHASGWGLDFTEVNSHVKVDGLLQPDYVAIVVILRGAGSTICEVPLADDRVLVLPRGARLSANARPGLSYQAATLPSKMWEEICHDVCDSAHPAQGRDVEAFDLDLSGGAIRGAAMELTAHLSDIAGASLAPAQPPDVLADHLGAIARLCFPNRGIRLDRSLRHRMRQAWQAQDYIYAHLHEPISITRLCRELGVSRRQLEYAFRTTFDVAPTEFIQLVRLNESRRLLQSARKRGQSVTNVAMEVGVNHLGRFALRYRQLFGESPHQTLAASETARWTACTAWPRHDRIVANA